MKIYRPEILENEPRRKQLQAKIDLLCCKTQFRADTSYAWPLFPVFADPDCSRFSGYAMRRCGTNTVSLDAVCSLRILREVLPGWNRIHVARTVVSLLDGLIKLDDAAIIPGDISPANFRVNENADVTFLDVDSFQIRDAATDRLFPCTVLTQRYAAPELLRLGRTDAKRDSKSLVWSAATIAYELLTSGLHPFSRAGGDDPITNVLEGRTAMGGELARGFLPHPLFMRYMALNKGTKWACVKTFIHGYTNAAARPTLREWRTVVQRHLDELMQQSQSVPLPRSFQEGTL